MKKKLDPLKKYLLIYSLELIIIAFVLLVLGILKITNILTSHKTRMLIFNIITLVGGIWIIFDFFWTAISKRRRRSHCLLDKILNLPIPLFLIPFDIYCFINPLEERTFSLIVGCVFLYVFVNYTFQGIYHYFKPLPYLVKAFEDEQRQKKMLEETPKKEDEGTNKE